MSHRARCAIVEATYMMRTVRFCPDIVDKATHEPPTSTAGPERKLDESVRATGVVAAGKSEGAVRGWHDNGERDFEGHRVRGKREGNGNGGGLTDSCEDEAPTRMVRHTELNAYTQSMESPSCANTETVKWFLLVSILKMKPSTRGTGKSDEKIGLCEVAVS